MAVRSFAIIRRRLPPQVKPAEKMGPKVSKSLIAIVAAYAIALQALLSGWIVLSHVSADLSSSPICTHDTGKGDTGGTQAPGPNDCCPCGPACTMAGPGLAVGVIGRPSVVVAWAARPTETLASIDQDRAEIPDRAGEAHLPRAPPAV